MNSRYDRETGEWDLKKVKWEPLISVSENEPEAMNNMGPNL